MKYSNTVEYNIKTNLDSKGITQLKSELQGLELKLQHMGNKDLLNTKSFLDAREQIKDLGNALSNAFDPSLGILNLDVLNKSLKDSGITADSLRGAFSQAGTEGQIAFNNLIKELGQVDIGIQRSNSSLDKMFTTFSNTFRWGIVSSFFSQFMNAIHQSVDYVKELDDSLTQIMLVTDYNRDSMNEYAKSANEAAKALSMSTTGMTNASLVFAQQGYDLNQSQELATLSAKLANASQQDTATTSDQITAYMNAYGLENSIEELTQQMDNWALIANVSAADVGELAQASQRAASMANAVGVSGEQLAAQIATIESVTREAPEQIGNGLKTLYARFSDIAAGKEDEDGFSLGKVTSELNKIGVQVLDEMGQIRDVGDIMEDLMIIWDDLDQTSKVAASQALAGKYQVNRFMALMDNSTMYQDYLGATGSAAAGTLDQMNQEYAESLAGRTQKLQTTLEGIFNNIFNTDSFNTFIDVGQAALDVIDTLTESMGGGIPIMTALVSLFTKLFSQNIAQQINDNRLNNAVQQQRIENFQDKQAALQQLGVVNPNLDNGRAQDILEFAKALNTLAQTGSLSNDQLAEGNKILADMTQSTNAATKAQDELETQMTLLGTAIKSIFGEKSEFNLPFLDDEGNVNTASFNELLKSFDEQGLRGLFKGSKEEMQSTLGDLKSFNEALQLMRDESRKTEAETSDLGTALQLGGEALQSLKTRMPTEEFKKLQAAYNSFADALVSGDANLEDTGEDIDTLTGKVGKLIQIFAQMTNADLSPDQIQSMVEAAEQKSFEAKGAEGARQGNKKIGGAFIDAGKQQNVTKEILNTVTAVGQLSSAWQTLANLPSILDNEDLDITEKMNQLITNLAVSIPMTVSAFSSMKKAAQTFAAAEGEATLATELLGGALTFLTSGPGIAAMAIIAALGFAVHAQAEEAKKAHDQAIANLEDTKNVQEQVADLSAKMDEWKSKRNSQGNTQELAQEADVLADSLRELGNAEEAQKIHLAAIRAEANGATTSFNELENTLNATNQSMSDQSALATMEAANAILKDRLSTTEEIVAANEAMQNAALDYNISQMSRTAGMDMGITSVGGDNDLRAATMDWQSLEGILDQSVPGFAEITDENEKLALALSHTSDEALRAAIQIEQLANANANLTEGQQTSITQKLEGSGFSAQESLQLMASLDENASYQQIIQQIEEVKQQVNAGTPFEIALQAKMDPEQVREAVEASLATYEPKDEDVDTADFQTLSGMFMSNADSMGEEGTPFADYSENLLSNAEALEEVVEGILRYDDAVQTLDKNLENWQEALADTNDFSQEHIDAVQDLQETYSDFLDLAEDMDVSEEFAANAKNLELMEDAANGVEGAYEELAQAAAEDILIHANVDDIDGAKEALSGLFDYLNSDAFSNLNIGDALDLSGVENQINALADTTGWTADQMAAYLNSIGINIDPNMFEPINTALDNADANTAATANHIEGVVEGVADTVVDNLSYSTDTEMTAQTDTQQDQIMYTNLTPTPGPTTTIESTFPVGSANPTASGSGAIETQTAVATVTGVTYEPQPVTEQQVKEMTGYGLKSEVTKGGGGNGGVHLKKGATATKGSRGGSGAGKASTASRPSSSGGGGGGGRSCFVAGTLVSTWGGFKPIEQIKKGNIVLSYNQQLGLNEYSEVLQTMIHDTIEPIYTLYIKDERLRVTGIHRFLVTNKIIHEIPQWVHAADLKVGDWVLFADGTWHVIHKIEINIEHQTVYNFEVSNNHNYYVGRNQILAHNKGGGKKGGGGGKKKEISTKEKKNHEKDYYEKVDSILDKTEKTLKGIQDKQDKLIGDKAQGNLRKQINLLEKELKVQKEKLKILTEQEKKDVERKLEKDDASLEKILKKNGINQKIPDFKRDMDGIIINYEEVSAAIDKAYNKLIDKQKAAAKAGKEETAKSIGEQIDKFEKLGESIRKGGKRSDEIQAQIEELNNTIQETEYAIQDARIEGFKLYSEARDGLKDILESGAELKKLFRDFDADSFIDKFSIDDTPYGDLIENLSKLDDIYNITEEDAKSYYDTLIAQKNEALKTETDLDNRAALENSIKFFEDRKAAVTEDGLQNGYLGIIQQDLAKLQEWMENPQAAENIWGTDENGLFETFKDLYNQLLDGFKDYRKTVQEARDSVLEIYDDTEEAIERQLKQFDRLVEKVERISDTYTLYYGEDSYDQLDKFYAQQGSIMQAQLDQLTAAYDLWRKNYEKALENGNEELIKKAKDLMDEAEDAMLDGAKELAELWVEKFENAVEANTQSIYNKLFNGQDFNDLSSNWELQKDYMERYKDDVEKSYEIEKLRSKYTDLLNDSQNASLLTQNKIRQQMQEQLQQLQEQATVSEYDVKLANARLEILQKQIALEDAQRNKRQMQLRRDSQGNYRYVYKADQKDVKEAQDDLLDSEFDAYELTKNETISNNDRALNLVQDFLSKRADIFNKYKDDDVAREKALEELSNNYSKLLAGMEEDFRDTTNGMFDVLTFMVQNGTEATAISAANMLDNLFEEEGKFKEDTEVLWAALVNTMTGALEEFQDAIAEANDELIDQAEDLKDKMTGSDGTLTKIGSSSEKMANSLNTATQATMNLAEATNQLFTAFNADNKKMEDALAQLKEYEDQLRSTQDTTSSLSKQLASANAAISAKTAEAQSYQDALDLKNGAKDLQNGQVITLKKGTWVAYHRDGDQYDASGKNGFKLEKDTQVTIAKTDHHHTSEKYGPTSELAKYEVSFYETGKKPTKDTGAGLSNKSDSKKTEMWHLDAASIRKAITYDTGGYTGKWDDGESNLSKNGKLAILHQKELVLNATDTENILNAVNVMREITNTLKNSNMYVSTFRNAVSAGNDTIEQRVEISATFPNVSSITDIEQALLNLSDQAYQYAHRNIKG